MRVSRRSLALAAVIAVSVAGCGGGGGGGARGSATGGGAGARSAAGVRQTLHELANDLLNGNAAAACSLYSTSALTRVFGSKSNCEHLLSASSLSAAEKNRLRQEAKKIDSLPVSIHGNTATVSNPTGSGTTTLTFENGHWLLDAPSSQSSSSTSTSG
jgi:hypothetical protein